MRWRRWLTIIACVTIFWMIWNPPEALPPPDVIKYQRDLILLLALFVTFYFGGASAKDIAMIVGSVKLFNKRADQGYDPYGYDRGGSYFGQSQAVFTGEAATAVAAGAAANEPDPPVPSGHPLAGTPFG